MNEYQPKGLFVSQNDKGQYVYSDLFVKGGYVISKSNYLKYRTYAMRYVIGIIVAILLSTFIPLHYSIIVGILTAIVGEILFRIKFLKKSCVYVSDFKKDTKNSIKSTLADPSSLFKSILRIILFIAFGVLLIINAYEQQYEGFSFYLCWVVGIIACLIALISTILVIKNKGNK